MTNYYNQIGMCSSKIRWKFKSQKSKLQKTVWFIKTFSVQISVTFVISNYSVLNVDTRKNLELCTAPNPIIMI